MPCRRNRSCTKWRGNSVRVSGERRCQVLSRSAQSERRLHRRGILKIKNDFTGRILSQLFNNYCWRRRSCWRGWHSFYDSITCTSGGPHARRYHSLLETLIPTWEVAVATIDTASLGGLFFCFWILRTRGLHDLSGARNTYSHGCLTAFSFAG